MWPNQVNYGYGQQPQMYPVFPSQNQSQQGHIQQIVPQVKESDIFLGKPIAVSQHYPYVGIPQVQMHTDVGTTVSQICHPVAENANNSATMKTSTKMKEERNGIKEVISPSTMRTTDNDTRAATAGKGEPFTIGEFTPEPENTAVEMWETGSGMKTTKADSWNCTTGMWNSAFGMGTGMIGMLDTAGMGDTTTRMGNTEMWNTSTAMWNTTTTGFEATTGGAMGDIPSSSLNSISSSKSTKFQTVLTLQWLIENYETCEGYSVPRCVVYDQYTEFCSSNNFEPINPATFGKLIRQIFINLKTRRLGIRGQSKYHYYGIRVKPTSNLSHSKEHFTPEPKMSKRWTVPSKVEVIAKPKVQSENQNQSEAIHAATISSPLDLEAVDRGLSPVTALGLALLPQFPKAYMLKSLPFNANIHQVDVFLTEYRTHCELLLEAILKGKFSEIYSIIMSFWQDLSVSNLQLLQMPSLAGTIYFCDILLYKTIIGILIPGTTQEVPQSLLKAVRIFAKDFRSKLSKYIQKLPKKVFEAKNQAATSFVKLLVRKSSLSHIAQATRSILDNSRAVKMMQADWKEKTDLENLRRQIDWLIVDVKIEDRPKLSTYFQEFEGLLEQKATVEQHVDWINEVMKAFVDKTSETEEKSMQNFLLYVSSISELVLRDHTLRSASSFGSYHLLHMLYNEYLLYRIEATSMANAEQQLMNRQIEEEYSARYSVPQLEKAVNVVYSELNSAGAQPVVTDFEHVSPNTSGLCIVEDVYETDVTTRSSSNESTQCCTSKLKNKEEESSSSLIHFKTSQLPTAISEETIQDPNDISRETSVKALESSSLTGCDFPDLSPHPQKVVIAGKTALVPPELISKTPSYVAAKVIKMEPKSEKGYNTMARQARQICKVNISPADANNLFKGQRINTEDGVQFIVNEVHKLPRGKSATGLGLPTTNKLSYKSPVQKVYKSL